MIDYDLLKEKLTKQVDEAETVEDIKPLLHVMLRIVISIARPRTKE